MAEQALPQQSEVIARSFSPDRNVPFSRTPEAQDAHALGQQLRKKYEATKAEKPLDALTWKPEKGLKSVDIPAKMREKLDRDDPTFITTIKLKNSWNEVQSFIDEGLPSLDHDMGAKKEIVDLVIKDCLDKRDAFASLSVNERQLIVVDLLSKPDVRNRIGEKMKRGLEDPKTGPSPDLLKNLAEGRAAVNASEEELKNNKSEIRGARKDIRDTQGKIEDHRKGGSLYQEIEDRTAKKGGWEDDKTRLSGELGSADSEAARNQAQGKRENGLPLSEDEEKILSLMDAEKELGKLAALEEERDGLPDKLVSQIDRERDLKDKTGDILNKKNQSQKKYEEFQDQKLDQEEEFLRRIDFENVLPDSINDFLNDEVDARNKAAVEQLEEDKRSSDSKDKQLLIDKMKDKYYKMDQKGHRTKVRMKKKAVYDDAHKLITKGPEGLTRDMLLESLPKPRDDSHEERAKYAQEQARIENRLRDEPDFAKDMQKLVTEKLIGAKMRSGALFEGEIMQLEDSDWGKDAINKVIDKDDKLKDTINKVLDNAGGVSYYDRIKSKFGGSKKAGFFAAIAAAATYSVGLSEPIKNRMINNEMGRKYAP